jgi:transcriptional regulator with XRE-family HTH domain
MKDNLFAFGKTLKDLRKKRNLTQKQFSEITGLHINYIGMIERGERNPSLLNICIIANGFNLSLSELFKDFELFEKLE